MQQLCLRFYMPRIKIWTDNKIIRPNERAERHSRRIGTRKRVGYAMAKRFIGRLACQETGLSTG